jgi:hypothetical protein
LTLEFGSWRPEGVEPAHLLFSLCDKQVGEVIVDKDYSYSFKLNGDCQGQVFKIKVLNPFTPLVPSDNRELGVRLTGMTITSPFGLPIVNAATILVTILPVLLTAMLFLYSRLWVLAISLPVLAGILISQATTVNFINIIFLWGLIASLGIGCLLGFRHPFNANGRIEIRGKQQSFDRGIGLLVFGVVCLAFGFRIYGIDFGLPGRFHPDETPKFNAIERMTAFNTWNPSYFLHPSLLLYATIFVESIMHKLGVGWDFNSSVRLSGRVVSALAGTFSVLFVYLIGARLYTRFVGVVAALLLAVFPLHVTCSRYMKEDALMTLFFLMAVFVVIVAVKNNRPWLLILAGIAAGFGLGTKYTGALIGYVVISAPWLASRHWKPERTFVWPTVCAILLIPVVFLITTPFAILDYAHFFKGLMSERKHMLRGHSVAIDAWSQFWMYHIRRSLLPGMTSLPYILSGIGVGLLLWRRRIEDLWVLSLLLLFLSPAEWVKAKPAPQPERYMVPCLPILAITVGELFRVLANSVRLRRLVVPLLIVVVSLPLWESSLLAYEVVNDTRERAARWMEGSLPAGSKVLVDWVPYVPQPTARDFTLEMFEPGMLIPDLKEIVDGVKVTEHDYLILSGLVYNRFFNQPFPDQYRRQVIKEAFEKLPILHQEIPVYKTYGFHSPVVTIFKLPKAGDTIGSKATKDIMLPASSGEQMQAWLERWLRGDSI